MTKPQLTILLPELAAIIDQDMNQSLIPRTLATMLKKGHFQRHEMELTRRLFTLFGTNTAHSTDLPMAMLRSSHQPALCVDPCYLHPDRDRLLLFAHDLNISAQEAQSIIDALQPLLNEFNATLCYYTEQQWVLELDTMPDLELTCLPDVNGKAVQAFLPKGQDKQQWIRLWNEIQMLLFELPLNQQRQSQGQLPINSVWFWGKGQLMVKPDNWQLVTGEHDIVRQLTDYAGIAYLPVVNDVSQWLRLLSAGNYLYVCPSLDLEGMWPQQLLDIDEYVLQPVWHALKHNRLGNIVLDIPSRGSYTLNTLDCWKFW